MNLVLTYLAHEGSGASFFARLLRRQANVVSFGPATDGRHDILTGFRPDVRALWPEIEKRLASIDWLLYIDPGIHYLPRRLEQAPCPTAAFLIDTARVHFWHRYLRRFFDLIFQYSPSWVPWCVRGRQRAFWLPGAADEATFRKLDLEKQFDLGFVGSTGYADRRRLLERLRQRFSLHWSSGSAEHTARIYNQSRIVFNYSVLDEVNLRVYEALACGSMLVTNRLSPASRLGDLFEDRKHLALYDEENLEEIVDYYLRHEDERERIAAAGREEVLRRHTVGRRVAEILAVLEANRDALGARHSTWRDRVVANFEAGLRTHPRLHALWMSVPHPFLPWCADRLRRSASGRIPLPARAPAGPTAPASGSPDGSRTP